MARGRRRPRYDPVDPEPTAEQLCSDGVLGVAEAAAFLGHRPAWVKERLRRGEIPSFVLGRRRVVPKAALVAYLAGHLKGTRPVAHDERRT